MKFKIQNWKLVFSKTVNAVAEMQARYLVDMDDEYSGMHAFMALFCVIRDRT